ncbi:MAG: DUF1989 domain-containing protein, partial [Pseudomonadota bacterium]
MMKLVTFTGIGTAVHFQPVTRSFSNMGHDGARRRFPGFLPQAQSLSNRLSPRDAVRFELRAGDLISLKSVFGDQNGVMTAFDERGQPALDKLGLTADGDLDAETFDAAAMIGWVRANGGSDIGGWPAVAVTADDITVFRATGPCTVWVICPAAINALISGAQVGQLDVSVTPVNQSSPVLPPPLGEVRDEFTVKRGTGVAYEVQPGEIVQIIDIEGQQCSDFVALRTDALERGAEREIDTTATRTMVRSAYPGPGLFDKFVDRDLNPMMRLVQDTCGRHDTFGLACTARGYEDRGFPGHVNCSDNISHALSPFGVERRPAWAAINFFWNTWVDHASHHLMTEESHSRPGDYVALRATDRLVCVSTACPDDLDPINGWNPTDVHVRIYRPDAAIRRAVAYREKEDAPMSISEHSAFEPETSK